MRAVVAAGTPVARVEIDPAGRIVIVAGSALGESMPNEWDGVLNAADQSTGRQ